MTHYSGYQSRTPDTARFPSRGTTGRFSGFQPQSSRNFGNFSKAEATPAQLMEGLGKKIATIPIPSSTVGQSRPISIQNFEEVASYSWTNQEQPTIVVPGSPPVWRERRMPYRVPRDSGTVILDHGAAKLSTTPLFALIAAVAHHAPKFPLSSVDFVTDRNGLRKLWRWAAGETGNFRIDVDLVGKGTVLMERWEPAMTQQGGPGYEREFEKASTTPGKGCENARTHDRIATYDLDGLKMLMRFRVDSTLHRDDSEVHEEDSDQDPFENLASHLKLLSLKTHTQAGGTSHKIPTFNGQFLTIIPEGKMVPQASLVELKTRSVLSVDRFDWKDTYPQMLLSQTPHVFVCVHERGVFKEVRKTTLEELEKGELARKSHESLRTLRLALGEIQNIMKEEGGAGKLSLVCIGGDISIHETSGSAKSLPPGILKKFDQ